MEDGICSAVVENWDLRGGGGAVGFIREAERHLWKGWNNSREKGAESSSAKRGSCQG